MRWIALALLLLVVSVGPANAETNTPVYRAVAGDDVAIPFWCDWGYDWDERCYRDFDDRLPVGGEDDKVWRSALRFPLDAIPPGSVILSATLLLSHDAVCLGPRKTQGPCPARTYTIDIHPVLSAEWHREREVDIGPVVTSGSFWAPTRQRLSWDVTDLVIAWVEYGDPNNGLLLKLADGEEDFGVGGPKIPSSEFANPPLRPALEVSYFRP